MWLVYQVDRLLDPVVAELCDLFLNHCEKGKRITFLPSGNDAEYSLKVARESRMDSSGPFIRVEGTLGYSPFRFRSTPSGFSFAGDNCYDPEGLFFDLLNLLNYYRVTNGMEEFKMGYLQDLTVEDCPPITGENYLAFSDDYLGPLFAVLNEHFRGMGMHEMSGKFAYTLYTAKPRALYPPKLDNYVPVCEKLLADFKSNYFIDDAMLLGLRLAGRQYVYFFVNGAGIYYHRDDDSRAVLEREHKRMTNSLSKFGHNMRREMASTDVIQYDGTQYEVYDSPY